MDRLGSSFRAFAILSISAWSLACSTPRGGGVGPGYFVQAALGQLQMSSRAKPIEQVLREGKLSAREEKALQEVGRVKAFGESEGLKATKNYTHYSDLKRSAAVWVVSGCEPLQFEAARWSFPVVGGFTYLGWFDREDARRFSEQLGKAGWDVDVRGASAYSTLGWFRDPVLSTMIPADGDLGELVEVILHESVHATLHLQGQSTLNESMAQFLGEKLASKYLEVKDPALQASYLASLSAARKREANFHEAYEKLNSLYSSRQSDSEKALEKTTILSQLREKTGWPQSRALNNATLIQFSTYQTGGAEFEELWQSCGKSTSRFLAAIRGWSDEQPEIRKGVEIRDLGSELGQLKARCR